MAWECRALCICECSATNERTVLTTSLLRGSHALRSSDVRGETEKEKFRMVDNAWQRDIVEQYTQLDLTVGTDRLSALAGLAKRTLTLRPGDQYIAGLRCNTLAAGLSWYIDGYRDSISLPGGEAPKLRSHMPTWSWAAVSGQVRHARVDDRPMGSLLIKILQIQYKAITKYRMASGSQTPAALLVWGYVVPIESLWWQKKDQTEGEQHLYPYYRVQWPPSVNLPVNCLAMLDVQKRLPPFNGVVRFDRLDGVEPEEDSMMLLTAMTKDEDFGLILRRHAAPGAVPAYERLGFVDGIDTMGWIEKSGSYEVGALAS